MGFEEAEEGNLKQIRLPTLLDHGEGREFQRNIYFFFIDYTKAFDCVDHNKLWKVLKEMVIPDYLTHLLRDLYTGQEAMIRSGHGTRTVKNWERSTTKLYLVTLLINFYAEVGIPWCELPGWMNHNLESRLPGEITTTSYMQMIPH